MFRWFSIGRELLVRRGTLLYRSAHVTTLSYELAKIIANFLLTGTSGGAGRTTHGFYTSRAIAFGFPSPQSSGCTLCYRLRWERDLIRGSSRSWVADQGGGG